MAWLLRPLRRSRISVSSGQKFGHGLLAVYVPGMWFSRGTKVHERLLLRPWKPPCASTVNVCHIIKKSSARAFWRCAQSAIWRGVSAPAVAVGGSPVKLNDHSDTLSPEASERRYCSRLWHADLTHLLQHEACAFELRGPPCSRAGRCRRAAFGGQLRAPCLLSTALPGP